MLSWIALVATIFPPLLFLAGRIELKQCHLLMLIATIVWFVVTPFWMERKRPHEAEELVI